MKKITRRGIQQLLESKVLLGINYMAVTVDEGGSVYTFNPNLRTVLEDIKFDELDGVQEMQAVITTNPRAKTERYRDNGIALLFEQIGVLQSLGQEGLGMDDIRQPKMSNDETVLQHDKYRVVLPSDGEITNLTIVGQKLYLVELTDEVDKDSGLTVRMRLLFGEEQNLYPLTTYISGNLTKADLSKFLGLLSMGVVSGNIIGTRYYSANAIITSINDFGGLHGGSLTLTMDNLGGKGKYQVTLREASITTSTTIKIIPNKVTFSVLPDSRNYLLTIKQHDGHELVVSIK